MSEPESDSVTYYTKGKDAEYFEKLSDADFAWQVTVAAMEERFEILAF
jgi:hypothetical protein